VPTIPPPQPPPFVTLEAPARVNHGAGLVALPGGALLACWYSGASEAGVDAAIVCARSNSPAAAWSRAWRVSSPGERDRLGARPAKSVGNVALARAPGGRLVMIQGEVESRRVAGVETCRSWRCGRIAFRVSLDEGRTWSAPTRLDDRPGALPRSRPLTLPGGASLVPVYREAGGAGVLSLGLGALMPGAPPDARAIDIPQSQDLRQPSLVAWNGAVVAFLRDHRRRWVWAASLDPARDAWTAPVATDLPNPDSAVEAFADGAWIGLIYNPSYTDRRTLALAFTRDGRRFATGCTLVAPRAAGEVAYPAVAETGDGIAVAFSIEGKRRIAVMPLSPAFLDACAAQPLAGQAAANRSSKFLR
jgi:predicted neuraminidase